MATDVPPPQPLPYGSVPDLDCILIERRPDRTIITIGVPRARATRIAVCMAILATAAAALLTLWITADKEN